VKGTLLAVFIVAATFVPAAASASHGAQAQRHLRLSLVPLQSSQLGPAGASLPIEFDSGTVSNRDAGTPQNFGRVSGYLLDYGDPYSGGAGVTSIQTQVEQFRTSGGAKKDLRFWKESDKLEGPLYRAIGIADGAGFFKVRAIGSGRFAHLMSLRIPNADPLYLVDEAASMGRFVLHATVWAGTASTAKKLAPALTAKVMHRLRLLLAGRLHGKPPNLPPPPTAGPPPGGPDLAPFVIDPSDLSGQTAVTSQGYGIDPTARSNYGIELRPAGPYDLFAQSVNWYADANEATWEGTLVSAFLFGVGSGDSVAQVDLSAVGDNAHGLILPGTDDSGAPIWEAVVVMWQGQAFDIAVGESSASIQPSSVVSLAKAMAAHLDAGLGQLSRAQVPTTWTSHRRSRSRSSSMNSTRCQVPSWSSPSRTGTDSPAVPSSMAMQWEWPLPWSMSSGQMFSVRRSQSSCA